MMLMSTTGGDQRPGDGREQLQAERVKGMKVGCGGGTEGTEEGTPEEENMLTKNSRVPRLKLPRPSRNTSVEFPGQIEGAGSVHVTFLEFASGVCSRKAMETISVLRENTFSLVLTSSKVS